MKNSYTLLMLLFFAFAQSQIQKGVVTDSIGNPIDNAYIINTNSQSHAHTNEFGAFSIDKTSKGDLLKVSALGFKKTDYKFESNEFTIILEEDIYKLDQVVIQPKMNAMNVISKIDLQTTPVNSSQEILRKVPGLFIGQHAGGGKAEQIFLRGFDIDHGTDIAVSVDGMPVNMVSHAHGQGYADLHFVIPETVDKIDFGKGTYYANKGDFATAGYVTFQTKERVDKSAISVEAGQFNTLRTVGVFNLLEKNKMQNAYLATEYILTDGPFDAPQDFSRLNLFGKYTSVMADNSKLTVIASRFTSKWNASGQIPQRLVDSGAISRFGAVDATEGGNTARTNVNVAVTKPLNENTFVKSNAYYSNYNFELYSNFTFFLEDPINGDQIRQKESRDIYGLNTEFNKKYANSLCQVGFGFRADATKNTELSHTVGRYTTLQTLKLGDIDQTNIFSYINVEYTFGKLKINPAIRFDYFKFNYQDKLAPTFVTQSQDKVKFSPKLNFIYSANNNLQLYLKSGFGFHSNDTRVVVAQTGEKILPTAIGTDLGAIFKPFPKLVINTALWYLYLEQEFVYVGDAGIVEPSGKTKRMGFDLGLRYQLTDWLFFDTDVNYTHARSIDEPSGQDYIPLAPDFTSTGGISINKLKGFSGGIRYRYLKSRPANEDNSIVAKGYMVSDVNINYEFKNFTFGVAVENIFNTKWNETQFATESRLQNETQSVDEIHFTPGTPFFMKGKITYRF
ncbi:TonB-dependent receptor plug domain-containing protein [Flavobacterium paronense]|uniref:TonB-dependent receptor n=1 Tax=Flavobacterium paronense TaxID=1392775 RepID=A0ABV5GGF4_9FLAO|nr:TonB-dependent receptor plug domain-containing protein [Flavobacterium paronense]MDN3677052.1 TonB-dependent receptor plug domain-containing protein [Flavobacterium paronense]